MEPDYIPADRQVWDACDKTLLTHVPVPAELFIQVVGCLGAHQTGSIPWNLAMELIQDLNYRNVEQFMTAHDPR